MANKAEIDEDFDLEVETDDLPVDGKPEPIEIEIAGREYTLSWSKDHFWMQYFAAFSSGDGSSLFRASMELLQVSLSPVQSMELEQRLRNMSDPLDTSDLMAAVLEMAGEWQEHVVERMENIGVNIPEKIKARLNRKERRTKTKAKTTRVVKAPSGKRK